MHFSRVIFAISILLGCAIYNKTWAQALPAGTIFVDVSWSEQSDVDEFDSSLTWSQDAFATIADAIAAAEAGGTISVAAGQYDLSQQLTVDKSLTLLGAQAQTDPRTAAGLRTEGSSAESIVDGGGVVSTLFRIEADNVSINGFDIRNGTGDLITSPSSGTIASPQISYNIIRDATGDEGIQLRNASDAVVEFNKVHDTVGDGINLSGSSTAGIVRNNEVHDIHSVNAAIYLDGAQDSTVQDNLIYNVSSNDGIKVGDKGGSNVADSGGQVIDNVIHDTAQDGISIYMSDITVSGNEIYQSASENGAIFVEFAVTNVTISNNNIHDNGSNADSKLTFGIRVGKDSAPDNVTISGNSFANNEVQLFNITGSIANIDSLVADNTFDSSATAGINITVGAVAGDPSTIQDAVTQASAGDVIFVPAGTYTEQIEINKSITLLGNQVGVDARSRSGQSESTISGRIILRSAADNVTIDGFTVLNGGNIGGENAGIFLASGATDATIRNNIFTRDGDVDGDSFRGILTTSNGGNINLRVTHNIFTGWATGVYLNPNATGAVVSDNAFINNFVGMSIDGPSNTTVSDNDFINNLFEGLGVGPGVDSPTLTLSGNSFSGNTTQLGVYTDITLNLSNESFDKRVIIDGTGFIYSTLQDAIDASVNGDTLLVYPGTYSESANYNPNTNSNDPSYASGNNPVGVLVNKSLSIQGVNSAGVPITDVNGIQATVSAGIQSNWGTSFLVSADDVTIRGLRLLGNSNDQQPYINKVVEVISDGFTLDASIVGAVAYDDLHSKPEASDNLGGSWETETQMLSAVYINDWYSTIPDDLTGWQSAISDYAITNSTLFGTIEIANGPGTGHDSVNMQIIGNSFHNVTDNDPHWKNNGIMVTGVDESIAWRLAPVSLPTDISANSFGAGLEGVFWVRGDGDQAFPDRNYIEALISANDIDAYTYGLDTSGEFAGGTYTGGYGPMLVDGSLVTGSALSMAVRPTASDFSSNELSDVVSHVVLESGAGVQQTLALQLFDQDVTPDVLYGSGNSNGGFTRSLSNNVEVGVRIHDRFAGANHSNGDGTYSPDAGFFSGSSGPGIWNFDFSINLNHDGGSNPRLFDEVAIELLVDLDPTTGTSFMTLDPLGTWTDNAYGDSTTANGAGDDTEATNSNRGVDSNFYVVQNSQNIGWLFDTDGGSLFDVTEDASYEFKLRVYDLNSNQLAQTAMTVVVGAGGQTLDRGLDSLTFPDALLKACLQDAALAQGWTQVSEVTSLSCTDQTLITTMGIDQLHSLVSLDLSNNQLTTIDVSNLDALQSLTITGNPLSQATITYLDAIDGINGLDVTRVLPPFTPPPSARTPGEVISQDSNAIDEEIDNITIPDDDAEVSQETVEAIDNVLGQTTTLARNTSSQVRSGEISTDEAVGVLNTIGSALNLAGSAANKGAFVDKASVAESVKSIADIVDVLSTNEQLEDNQIEELQLVTQKAVGSVTGLINTDSSEEEVETLVGDVGRLLTSTGNASAGLRRDVVTAAKTLSQRALDSTLSSIAAKSGVAGPVDPADVEASRALVGGNSKVLDRVLKVASVEVPSTAKVDKVALTASLTSGGLDATKAENLTNNLSRFVNPVGVNLELDDGTSVNALDAMVRSVGDSSTSITVDNLTGALKVNLGEASVPVNVKKVAVVPPAVPDGVRTLRDGSALSVSDGVGTTIVPAPNDPIGLVTALSEGAEEVSLKTNGGVTITSGGQTFSGTFGFDSVSGSSSGSGSVVLNTPLTDDPTDPNYTFTVDYPDGSRQAIAPFVADDNFFDSLDSLGLNFETSRTTGIVTIVDEISNSEQKFRPDYFVSPPTVADQEYLDQNADETGIAYRPLDVNGDGVLDFQAISAAGVQVIYGLP